MELALVGVVGVVSIVAVAAFSERVGVATPLILVVVGGALGFVPAVPDIELDPQWVIDLVLPPLLYSAAVRMPAIDFRRDIKAIIGLAAPLVVLTMACFGLLLSLVLPTIGLATAFAVGAVVSPTDAVAATSVGRRLGLPSRLLTILEGEGLVNDATALVLLSSAITAMTTTVHPGQIGLRFLWAVVGAAIIGAVVGPVTVWVRGRLADPVLTTAMSFAVPFLAFLPAEELGASGVLAVVVVGIVNGHRGPAHLRASDRLSESVNWSTAAFLLENAIFLVMGLQLHTLVDRAARAGGLSVTAAVGLGLAATVVVIVVRALFVGPLVATLRHDAARAENLRPVLRQWRDRLAGRDTGPRHDRIARRIVRAEGDIAFRTSENFGWHGGVVLAWSGMRGAVTVAAAQTLPADTPYRPQLLLIAFVVAVTTLLVQGLTLPAVIRGLRIPPDDPEQDRAEFARVLTELSRRAAPVLDDATGTYPTDVVTRVRDDYVRDVVPDEDAEPAGEGPNPHQQYRRLAMDFLTAQQEALVRLRSAGGYRSRTLTRVQLALDRERARLESTAGG